MLDECAIRSMSLGGNNKRIRGLLISKQGLIAYRFIFDKREATTRDVSEYLCISIQHASVMLDKLYKQQYLRRDQYKQESGGYEWNYYP